jgi:hypothetical protein
MAKKTIITFLIGFTALVCVGLVFNKAISSFIITIFHWPYICSNSIEESKDKGMFVFKYQHSKNTLCYRNEKTAIRIADTVFVERRYKLSWKNRKGIEALDSSYILIVPCQYEDSVYQDYNNKWTLNFPFSAHPNKICTFFTKGSANQYTFPPDTLILLLIDNTIDIGSDIMVGNRALDSIILIKKI